MIRQVTSSDLEACSAVLHKAFTDFAKQYNQPSDFPTVEYATNSMTYLIDHPRAFGLAEELDGEIAGFAFIYERDPILTIGPVAVSTKFQNQGIAKRLLTGLLDRGKEAVGVRLVTDAFNPKSLPLYTRVGFTARETCLVLKGKSKSAPSAEYKVRPLVASDIEACGRLCRHVHGVERTNEVDEAVRTLSPYVAWRDGNIVAYATSLTRWHRAHGVAYKEEDLKALILGVGQILSEPLAFLSPLSQTNILRFCFEEGFKAVKPMTLMSVGMYQQPNGCYFPSVLY